MTGLIVREREATLLDVVDRLLDKGVVVAGDLTLSVAEVDLIGASLRLVVSSVDKLWGAQPHALPNREDWGYPEGGGSDPVSDSYATVGGIQKGLHPLEEEWGVSHQAISNLCGPREGERRGEDLNPDKAANGLAQLVLTLVDLLRNLSEREALRRMERGTLSPREIERLGQAFLRLEQKMKELKEFFHLQDEDLNLNLGPLGKLM